MGRHRAEEARLCRSIPKPGPLGAPSPCPALHWSWENSPSSSYQQHRTFR